MLLDLPDLEKDNNLMQPVEVTRALFSFCVATGPCVFTCVSLSVQSLVSGSHRKYVIDTA